jgi:hypothetical protein
MKYEIIKIESLSGNVARGEKTYQRSRQRVTLHVLLYLLPILNAPTRRLRLNNDVLNTIISLKSIKAFVKIPRGGLRRTSTAFRQALTRLGLILGKGGNHCLGLRLSTFNH